MPEGEHGSGESAEQAEAKARAAALYDEGLRLYASADYVRAAERFLEADLLLPSSEALQSAIAAARKAEAHLLVARAAVRAVARKERDPALAANASAALVEAERHLARLRADCAPKPCTVFLDGQRLEEPEQYIVPGSRHLAAAPGLDEGDEATQTVSESFTAKAGGEYAFTLDARPRTPSAPLQSKQDPGRVKGTDSQTTESLPQPGLPPWTFYAGVGTTGALGILAVWSGLDTLDARDDLRDRDALGYAEAREDVYDRATRTDWLLGATLVTGAATAVLGGFWVNWGDGKAGVEATPRSDGAFVRFRRCFY